MSESIRTPPYNPDAEQTALGQLLFDNRGYRRVSKFLQPEHFGSALHGRIFAAIGKLIERGQIANPLTVKVLLGEDEALDAFALTESSTYLVRLVEACGASRNYIEDCGRIILDLHLRRCLIDLGEEIVNYAFRQDFDDLASKQIERAQQRLIDLARQWQHSDNWWAWYNDYLNSDAWRAKRRKVLDRCGGLCEGCRNAPVNQVHHLTYAHVGDELLYELVGLCVDCHERAHHK